MSIMVNVDLVAAGGEGGAAMELPRSLWTHWVIVEEYKLRCS